MSRSLKNVSQELQFNLNNIPGGRTRILPDGRVGKFGWKGQFATLEEFVAAACAVEIGLTNPRASQHLPREHKPDEEALLDISKRQFHALVGFVQTLPRPVETSLSHPSAMVEAGRKRFEEIGCAACHTPNIGGLEGVYCDFCLYRLDESRGGSYGEEPPAALASADVRPDEWKTPPLWGVADSAPYMHDGTAPTLQQAIRRHGGAARKVRDRFQSLPESQQQELLAFLGSLRAPGHN